LFTIPPRQAESAEIDPAYPDMALAAGIAAQAIIKMVRQKEK
jgi:hypothetical protein